ncbi:hypothetical protein [Streptomyces sp. NBC_01601]|uniref:hypothetical protein n=1 Tax=Streptomyces sp. NBC_01601 TaxID=2975892 RepID=UPI002E297139|nr:hypothetical protein [Streptomyces sp. NBC_01601]
MADLPYWRNDPALTEARETHRLLSEPFSSDGRQAYLGSCSAGDWEAGRPLDAEALREEFDLHMGAVQVHSR